MCGKQNSQDGCICVQICIIHYADPPAFAAWIALIDGCLYGRYTRRKLPIWMRESVDHGRRAFVAESKIFNDVVQHVGPSLQNPLLDLYSANRANAAQSDRDRQSRPSMDIWSSLVQLCEARMPIVTK